MGNFYTNVTLRTDNQARVADTLRKEKRHALVSAPVNGSVVVFDKQAEMQDPKVLTKLSASLSKTLQCAAFAVSNHDDDLLTYTLHENGKLVDEYVSAPSFFDESEDIQPPSGGDAEALRRIFAPGADAHRVTAILQNGKNLGAGNGFTFEVERHQALAETLGLPMVSVGLGFNYLDQGEFPEDAPQESFVRTP